VERTIEIFDNFNGGVAGIERLGGGLRPGRRACYVHDSMDRFLMEMAWTETQLIHGWWSYGMCALIDWYQKVGAETGNERKKMRYSSPPHSMDPLKPESPDQKFMAADVTSRSQEAIMAELTIRAARGSDRAERTMLIVASPLP
jgi:hypothetical protein